MARRRKDILGSFISAVEKEAKRSAREYDRHQRYLEKERARRAVLSSRHSALKNACSFSWQMEKIRLNFKSLHNNNVAEIREIIEKFNNSEVLIDILNCIKIGNRVQAIEILIENSNITYNEILDIISNIECNLIEFLEKNEETWFDDAIGEYEFLTQNDIFEITEDIDFDTSKAEVSIECIPLDLEEIVTGKDPSVVQNKIVKTLKKVNDKWNTELCKYHEKRENLVVSNLKKQFTSIIDYDYKNGYKFEFEELFNNEPFVSKLEIIEPPILKIKNIIEIENKFNNLGKNKPTEENIHLSILDKVLLKTPLKEKVDKKRKLELEKLIGYWEKQQAETKASIEQEIEDAKIFNKNEENTFKKKSEEYKKYLKNLESEKETFLLNQKNYNEKVQGKIIDFQNGVKEEVEEFVLRNLEFSVYPFLSKKNIELSYSNDNKILIIDYELPNIENIYNIDKINYNATKNNFTIIENKENVLKNLYNDIIYKICLRTISEIFELDNKTNLIDIISFNGILSHIDRATGQERVSCICSLQTNKNEFQNIDLKNVDPKTCFKSLKGIAATELASLTPIRPIMMINKEDSRFIDAYDVIGDMGESYNLATMDWQDFENLVREIFEKEFSQNGGEVKVTQSSRDGGVDAIAFDPDPIRGGKIVIQAKRYTNVVGVSAVRDLYGTVMNEGAIKGILVTTSDYGPDSYEFIKDKPLALLNGSNLLHLLEKHGHSARININEAKMINKQINEDRYYVNDNMQAQSQAYLVHKEGCSWLSLTDSKTYLGDFQSISQAIDEAEKYYSPIEPCEHCCTKNITQSYSAMH